MLMNKMNSLRVSGATARAMLLLAATALSACGGSSGSDDAEQPVSIVQKCDAYTGPDSASLKHYTGAMHEHSSYSDGDIHSVPADYYRAIRESGYDYAAGSEHSDTLDALVFISLGDDCFTTPDGLLTCLTPTSDELLKWRNIAAQAGRESGEDFFAIRGFEWTSDRFGHINVYFSRNFSNAKTDLGYLVTMETFWQWFAREPNAIGLGGSALAPLPFGGGADGLAHFNHPSDKCLFDGDPGCNWNDFKLIPSAVERMFGMELYNGGRSGSERYMADFVRALDKGWRLSPVGGEDEHGTDFGSDESPKTVTIAQSLDEAGFREAWLARRTYALAPGRLLHADVVVDEQAPMGARLNCNAAQGSVSMRVRVTERDGSAFAGDYRLFSSGGIELATASGDEVRFELSVEAGEERWFFVRADDPEGGSAAYLAPVWIRGK